MIVLVKVFLLLSFSELVLLPITGVFLILLMVLLLLLVVLLLGLAKLLVCNGVEVLLSEFSLSLKIYKPENEYKKLP